MENCKTQQAGWYHVLHPNGGPESCMRATITHLRRWPMTRWHRDEEEGETTEQPQLDVRAARKKRGLTLQLMADTINRLAGCTLVDKSCLSRVEKQNLWPHDANTCVCIMEAYRIDIVNQAHLILNLMPSAI